MGFRDAIGRATDWLLDVLDEEVDPTPSGWWVAPGAIIGMGAIGGILVIWGWMALAMVAGLAAACAVVFVVTLRDDA